MSNGQLIASYDAWRSSRLGQITDRLEQELLLALLGSVTGAAVLDVGCGDALLAAELARRGGIVTGVDADAAMIAAGQRRACQEKIDLELLVARAEHLPFDDAAFDRVLAVATLCFVRDAERAIKEMARVLKPGGLLLVGELGRFSLWAGFRRIRGWLGDPTWRRVRFRTAAELRHLSSTAGLDVVAARGAIHYPPCAIAAQVLAPVDLRLGRHTTFGAAFIALSARKTSGRQTSPRSVGDGSAC